MLGLKARGGCVLSVEKIRMFDISFTNCVATNSASVTNPAGGALFVRAPDNVGLTFRPDVWLTRVSFKGNKALAGGSATNPEGGEFFLGANNGRVSHVLLTDVPVGGPNAAIKTWLMGTTEVLLSFVLKGCRLPTLTFTVTWRKTGKCVDCVPTAPTKVRYRSAIRRLLIIGRKRVQVD